VGKGNPFSELDAYLEDQQRGKKRSLSEIEKGGAIAALNRCRELVRQIQSDLANKSSGQMTRLQSLADLQVSLERAAFVLANKAGQSFKSRGGDC
jgi:hypothetical protein